MFMDMNVNLSQSEWERWVERETVTEAMQWNEVISVADLVIYHYFLMTPACVIQYLLRPLWVMATMWHWHSCINQYIYTVLASSKPHQLPLNPLSITSDKIERNASSHLGCLSICQTQWNPQGGGVWEGTIKSNSLAPTQGSVNIKFGEKLSGACVMPIDLNVRQISKARRTKAALDRLTNLYGAPKTISI